VLSEAKNEPTKNWRGVMLVTSAPTSSTMPRCSCPIGVGSRGRRRQHPADPNLAGTAEWAPTSAQQIS
jgi:hypothetical protein